MRALNRSERTIATYLQGLRQAEGFLREQPDPGDYFDKIARSRTTSSTGSSRPGDSSLGYSTE
jgi:hypothetical protein